MKKYVLLRRAESRSLYEERVVIKSLSRVKSSRSVCDRSVSPSRRRVSRHIYSQNHLGLLEFCGPFRRRLVGNSHSRRL